MISKAARVALLSAATIAALLATACSGTVAEEEDPESAQEAISTLAASECRKPAVRTSAKEESGRPIEGSAHTTLQGCVVGSAGETGTAVVGRVAAILADTQELASVRDTDGKKVFEKFRAGRARGTLETRITQDIEVTLAMDNSPTTTLHIEQRKTANGNYVIDITNATALKASVAFFTVTVVEPGELKVNMKVKPEVNGVSVSGTADIILLQKKELASDASMLVKDLFGWLGGELAKSAPSANP